MEIDNSPPRKNNLQYIQALRAIAAMLVVLCHARDFLKGTEYEWLAQRLFWPGAFGVDLFFIISGFIIIYTSHSYQSNDLIKFIKKRFLRVWPLYFIMTIAYIVIVKNVDLSLMHGFSYNQSSSSFELTNIIKGLLFIPLNTESPIYFGPPSLFVGWTLNYEIYFYLVCAIGIALGKFRYTFYILWFFITLLALPSIAGVFDRPKIEGLGYINLTMQSLIWEFVFGAIIAILYKSGNFSIRDKRIAIPLISIGIIIPVWAYITQFDAGHGIFHSGKFFCIMFACFTACSDYIQDNIKIPRIFIMIGDASYSLYLVHPITFILCFKMIDWLGIADLSKSFSFIFIVFITSVAFALLSYKYIEKNIPR
ncbi:acyltransferase [Escherichia coli]|nr:acyltransferase [Escherichia coli]EEC8207058.1 acyltransferase [Escherichia coli]EEQ6383633.1 acyltransferase [Escherichia coli]EES9406921.1 acyltransferase [Escherichia coli]EET1884649.1 acyltransferase [Escherichia coli]